MVYIALGLVAASMLGDVAAYGQASIESPYDGEWLAKVSCTESIYRRPPFTYQAKIPVEKGRIQKTFQNTQENTTTTNTWTGRFTNNELKIEINGSNSNGEKWRYLLKGELNSPYAVSLIGPYFDARGNKSRTCNIAFNSTKPDELRQATQMAEQETARLKQELVQKEQALAAAQASTAAARTQAQQGLSQEAQAAIDAQRQAAQRAEQETARLKQELVQKEQALAAAQATALSERNQLQQLASQQAEAAANVQRQAGQKFALEIAQLRTELSQRSSEIATLTESEAQRRNDLERNLRQEAQNSITAKQNEVQRLTSELADVKAELSKANPQIETLLEQEAKRRSMLEVQLRDEATRAVNEKNQQISRVNEELAKSRDQISKTSKEKQDIIEQESVRRSESERTIRKETEAAINNQKFITSQVEQALASANAVINDQQQKLQKLQVAQQEFPILQQRLAQKERELIELRDYNKNSKNTVSDHSSPLNTSLTKTESSATQQINKFFVDQPREDLRILSEHIRSQNDRTTSNSRSNFDKFASVQNYQTPNHITQISNNGRSGAMYGFLEGLLTISGLILLASIVVPRFDAEKKWTALFDMLSTFSFKISALALAGMTIYATFIISGGILSIGIIGVYVACTSIIISSVKDLFSGSQFLTNLATVASHKATQMQEDVNRKAAEMAEAAKKSESQDKPNSN